MWHVVNTLTTIVYAVEVEVLTAVVMNGAVFWHITLCSPVTVNRRFRGTFRLHHQGQRINQERNQRTTPRHVPENRTFHCLCCLWKRFRIK
jgi:hypothetical protein